MDNSSPLGELPVTALKGVGPRQAERLQRLGITSVQDLLFHLPFRYQDRTHLSSIGTLRPGDEAVIVGEIGLTQLKYGRRRSLLCHVSDGTGAILLRFFHFSGAQQESLARGLRIRCFGEVRSGPGSLEMVHPEYRLLEDDDPVELEESLTPIYPTTEGLHQIGLRKLTDAALALLDKHQSEDLLPETILRRYSYPPLSDALRLVHRPPVETTTAPPLEGTHPAQQRLAFEELLAHHLSLRTLRAKAHTLPSPLLNGDGRTRERFRGSLPFALTGAQERVIQEIQTDLQREHPMQRLIQGDVGSGKTVVAAMAALQALESGYQVAVMAPTEILAEQHYKTFSSWLEPLGIGIAYLTGRLTASGRREVLSGIASGEAGLVLGTHALFQEEVEFSRLGLVIVDEQHRFGVHQRLALREKGRQEGRHPHQLIMTATPIPRTLAMTAYADLDTSVIDELPPGRTPVEIAVIPDSRRDEVVERIRLACRSGRQAYWVCTLIDESELLQAQAASESAEALAAALPELKVGLVHGRMKPAEKEAVMGEFKQGETDLLVATTVIEVGVDVPRASLMVIENAERLGLAQLHQLRGRVGRGSEKSNCLLLYHGPLSQQAKERLGVMRDSNDGFVIAQKDLEQRGPGELLGTRQTGLLQFRIADLTRDEGLLSSVEAAAGELLERHPERVSALLHRWVGNGVQYGHV